MAERERERTDARGKLGLKCQWNFFLKAAIQSQLRYFCNKVKTSYLHFWGEKVKIYSDSVGDHHHDYDDQYYHHSYRQ